MKKFTTLILFLGIHFCGYADQKPQNALAEHLRKTIETMSIPLFDYCIKATPELADDLQNSKKKLLAVVNEASVEFSSELPEVDFNVKYAEKELEQFKILSKAMLERIKKTPAKDFCQNIVTKSNKINKEIFLQEVRKKYEKYIKTGKEKK